jgi:coenzyme PQQ precursor peptide PqqA
MAAARAKTAGARPSAATLGPQSVACASAGAVSELILNPAKRRILPVLDKIANLGPAKGFDRRTSGKRESQMAWKAPKVVEVSVGMEINMYMCATRK